MGDMQASSRLIRASRSFVLWVGLLLASWATHAALPTPTGAYYMDNCNWNGSANEVLDSSGNARHGTSSAGLTTDAATSKVCRSASFPASNGTEREYFINVPAATLHGLTDFTIAIWYKATDTHEGGLISGMRSGEDEALLLLFDRKGADKADIKTYINGTKKEYKNLAGIGDGNWHHVVWKRSGTTETVYVDGVSKGTNTVSNTALSITSLIVGKAHENDRGTGGNSKYVEGYLDELRMYGSAVADADISTLYSNQNGGRNDDGTSRNCAAYCAVLVKDLRMDECRWADAVDEVLDSSSNANHGRGKNGATTATGRICKAGSFDGDDDKVTGTWSQSIADSVSIAAWFKSPGGGRGSPRLVEFSEDGNESTSHVLGFDRDGTLRGWATSSNGSRYGEIDYNTTAYNDDAWHHAVYVYDGSVGKLYVDAVLKTTTATSTNPTSDLKDGAMYAVGGYYAGHDHEFYGRIDEAKIYNGALTASEINTLYTATRTSCGCAEPIANFQLDECSYTPASGEVLDEVSGAHGTPIEEASTTSTARICRALDVNTAALGRGEVDDDYVNIPVSVIHGKTQFSFSIWFKTSNSRDAMSLITGSRSGAATAWRVHISGGGNSIKTYIDEDSETWRLSSSVTDGNWHHLAWSYDSAGNQKFYIDGTKIDEENDGVQTINITSLYLGMSTREDGSDIELREGKAFNGQIDEVLFYDTVLTDAQVSSIYSNQRSGLNYDGTARSCSDSCATLVAGYKFDHCSFAGTAGEVTDYSGNSNNLTARNGTAITTGKLCKAGSFDGTDDKITGTWNQALNKKMSLSAWFKTSGGGTGTRRLIEASANSGAESDGSALVITSSGGLKAWARSSNGSKYGEIDFSTTTYRDDAWHQAVYTYDNTAGKLYVDGVLKQTVTSSNPSGDLKDATTLALGGSYNSDSNFFSGSLDEARIYNGALSASQISRYYTQNAAGSHDDGSARSCPSCSSMDHYTIAHSGTGIACEDQVITITAHNSSHSTTSLTNTTTITLSTSTGKGQWSKVTGQAGGTLTDTGGADDGGATYAFAAAGESSIQLYLRHVQSGTVNINLTDGTYTESSGSVEGGADPDLVISDAGLRFYADNTHNAIGTQISGKASNVAPSNQTIKIKAIQTNTDTMQCEAAITGAQTVGWALECTSPATCVAGQSLSLSNGGTASLNASGAISSYNTSSMTFDANGETTFNFTYSDAGQIRLNARWGYTKPDNSLYYLTGTSNTFTVRPFGYYVSLTGNPAAADHTGSAFKKAGQTFAATVTAKAWAAADDANNDGVPDGYADTTASNNADLSNNSTTPNYGNETSPPAIALAVTHIHPTVAAGGVAGALGGTVSLAPSNGVATSNDLTYSEVGVVELGASVSTYMTNNSITGKSGYVGRFYPDHFTVTGTPTLTQRSALGGCSDSFTYMGESMGLSFALEARNASDAVTTNYEEPGSYDYAYLSTSQLSYAAINAPGGSATTLTSRLTNSGLSGTWSNGRATYTGTHLITRPTGGAATGPFSDLRMGVRPVDADSVALAGSALNLDPAQTGSNTHRQLVIGNVRLGRLFLESAIGSELKALTIPLRAEYYNGSNWLLNTIDNCTTYNGATITFSNYVSPLTTGDTTASGSGTVSAGRHSTAISLSAPSGGHTGSVEVTLPLSGFAYLRGNWDGVDQSSDTDLNDDDPTAKATFGATSSSTPIIYRREQY
jgi:MSHA biogenesis protein MshQ